MEKSKQKTIGVLFSGGLDSTYLIWDNLSKGNKVVPLYIKIDNNVDKSELELNRVNLLLKEFKKDFDDNIIDFITVTDIFIHHHRSLHLNQAPMWITGLIYSQHPYIDEFQIGYVMNDDAIPYIDDIINIYKSYKPIMYNFIPLSFPLTKTKKEYIIKELPENYVDLTVSCENPNLINKDKQIMEYKPCGRCPACKKIINNKLFNNKLYDDIIFKEALFEIKYNKKCLSKEYNDNILTLKIEDVDRPVLEEPGFEKEITDYYIQKEIEFNYE